MKKKKLVLNRLTVRLLGEMALGRVGGGTDLFYTTGGQPKCTFAVTGCDACPTQRCDAGGGDGNP